MTIYEVTIYDDETGCITGGTTKSTYEAAELWAADAQKATIQAVQI